MQRKLSIKLTFTGVFLFYITVPYNNSFRSWRTRTSSVGLFLGSLLEELSFLFVCILDVVSVANKTNNNNSANNCLQ